MDEFEKILKLLSLNPSSTVILTSSITLVFLYLFRIRLILIERKLGITQNGIKPLEQVITRADLNEFGERLIKDLTEKLVTKDICALQHNTSIESIDELKEEIRARRR